MVFGIKEEKETRKKIKEENRICFIEKNPFLPVQNSDLVSKAHNFSHASEEILNITSRPRILRPAQLWLKQNSRGNLKTSAVVKKKFFWKLLDNQISISKIPGEHQIQLIHHQSLDSAKELIGTVPQERSYWMLLKKTWRDQQFWYVAERDQCSTT